MLHLYVFILGTILGSFTNVVLSRRGWYRGRSRCDICRYTLKWYDLVPILSFVCLGGRCRKCRERISPDHLLAELLFGITAVCICCVTKSYENIDSICIGVGLFFMLIAAVQDMKEKEIYAAVLYAGIISAGIIKLVGTYITCGAQEALMYFVCITAFRLVLWLFGVVLKDKIGEGDFDILLIMYIILGGYGMVYAVFFASFAGCVVYLPLIFLKKHKRQTPIPFIPLLHIGTILCLTVGGALV